MLRSICISCVVLATSIVLFAACEPALRAPSPCSPSSHSDVARSKARADNVEDVAEHATPPTSTNPDAPSRRRNDIGHVIGNCGVAINVPEGSVTHHDNDAQRHSNDLGRTTSVTLQHSKSHARTTSEMSNVWNRERDLEKIDDGNKSNGLVYAVRTLTVRDGRPGRLGHHMLQPAGRVFAILPLGDHHVRCTRYVEHHATASDPDLRRVKEIYLSWREVD